MKRTQSANSNSDRELAFDILMRVFKGAFLKDCLKEAFDKTPDGSGPSRAFVTKLCEGVYERYITLDHLISKYSNVRLNKIKPQILTILRMGIYQIVFMDSVPESAAVNESVAMAKRHGFAPLSGYVNAVLRSAARDDPDPDSIEDIGVRYSVPSHIVELFMACYGSEKAEKMLKAGLEKQRLYGRACPDAADSDTEKLCEKLAEEGITACPCPVLPCAIEIETPCDLEKSRSFAAGLFTIQDVSSQLVSIVAKDNMKDDGSGLLQILDLCAAPGGKTVHLAQLFGKRAHITARDISEKKTALIRENLERMNVENVTVQVFDACGYDSSSEDKYDLVLADLPCSGLGVIGRKKDIKYRVTVEDMKALQNLQRQILDNAVRYVKKGGLLLYSTCTVNPGENKEQVDYLLEKGLIPVSFETSLPDAFKGRGGENGSLQLLQGVDACDGFFISLFRRNSRTPED